MSLEENVNENVKPETSTENKTENNTGENREEGTKMARRPQNRRPRRVPRVPKAVKAEEKEENGSRETAEPKTEEKRKAAPARGRQQGTKRSFPAVKEAGEKRAPLRKPTRNSQKEAKSKLKIIPLGGLEQIGMNITAFEYPPGPICRSDPAKAGRSGGGCCADGGPGRQGPCGARAVPWP